MDCCLWCMVDWVQKKFHSLNININEIMLENLRSMMTDYYNFSNKQIYAFNLNQTKKLIIKNFKLFKVRVLLNF